MKTNKMTLNKMVNIMEKSITKTPTPSSISYMWNSGSMLGLILISQLISGIMISMHYSPNTETAFKSTMHIMRDINMGWLMRNMHMNGASMFFIMIYFHISRGMMFKSYFKKTTWMTGTIMILLLMATAFMGYVLPWGQMSFWGTAVITNLLSAIPMVGENIVKWVWGGFSVSNPTLNRFYTIHFVMPFMITAMSMMHLMMLHEELSSNPLAINKKMDIINFNQSFTWKDMNPFIMMMSIIMMISCLKPNMMGDPENFIESNSMMTPEHIQPEWYFLFAYAILRSIPNKLGGVVALVMSIMIILFMSMKKKEITSSKFSPKIKMKFMMTSLSFLMLTWLGSNPAETPFNAMSQMYSTMYFTSMVL